MFIEYKELSIGFKIHIHTPDCVNCYKLYKLINPLYLLRWNSCIERRFVCEVRCATNVFSAHTHFSEPVLCVVLFLYDGRNSHILRCAIGPNQATCVPSKVNDYSILLELNGVSGKAATIENNNHKTTKFRNNLLFHM